MDTLRIPKERVAIFLKNNYEALGNLKKQFNADISLRKDGEIEFEAKDPVDNMILKDVLTAIGRGFDPRIAQELEDDSMCLSVINVKEYESTSKGTLRIKGRLIGKNGKIKAQIEKDTDTRICVYGKTVSMIGTYENIYIANHIVELILSGKPYSAAFYHLKERGEVNV